VHLPLPIGIASVGLGLPSTNPTTVTLPVVNQPAVNQPVSAQGFGDSASAVPSVVAPAALASGTAAQANAGSLTAAAAGAVGAGTAVLASTGFDVLWLVFAAALLLLGLIVLVGSRKIRATTRA
jgi:hypothetical protein